MIIDTQNSAASGSRPERDPGRRRRRLRGITITAAAAAVLFGGAAVAGADTGGDESGTTTSPATSAPAIPDGSTTTGVAGRPAHTPHLDGDVSSVASGSILITDHDGFTRTINTSDATTYSDGISLPIAVGEHIHADGTVDADGTSLDATTISIAPEPPAPPSDGNLPTPPSPPADGMPPAPPTDGSVPAPPMDGSVPAPPALPGNGSAPAAPSAAPSSAAPTTSGS